MTSEYDVIIGPRLSEKQMMLQETENKAVFKVNKKANKIEIKKAVEKIFDVQVEKVTTLNCKGKRKRLGKYEGKRPDWKKAIVKLKEGSKIDFLEGM
jgi:large subunit ribosomal protein L23